MLMDLYFSISHIPEMKALSRPQKRFVKKRCCDWLFLRIPYRAGSVAIGACFVFWMPIALQQWNWGVWKSCALGATAMAVLSWVYDMIWIAHWRAEVSRFIRLHAAEIESAAEERNS